MNVTNALTVHADPPLTSIVTVHESDIICGRGGLSLKHPGNAAYRQITSLNKEIYATCPKSEKLRISKSIVNAVREINARFLEREDGKTSRSLDETDAAGNPVTWRDIGDKRAIEKTSQALREGQPKLLKKLKEELDHTGDNVQDETGVNFSIPLNHGGAQPLQQGMLGDVQMFGNQPPSQLQPESFTLTSLVGTHTMSSPSSLPLGFLSLATPNDFKRASIVLVTSRMFVQRMIARTRKKGRHGYITLRSRLIRGGKWIPCHSLSMRLQPITGQLDMSFQMMTLHN